jgi:hypothetical protein
LEEIEIPENGRKMGRRGRKRMKRIILAFYAIQRET